MSGKKSFLGSTRAGGLSTWEQGRNTGFKAGEANNELQFYTNNPKNVRIEDGKLIIEVHQENHEGCMYTSARLKTEGLQSWTFGRFEAKIKVPSGKGIWPAFWMLGDDIRTNLWPSCGEIDIMEIAGKDPSAVHGTVHGPEYCGGEGIGGTYRLPDEAPANDFHVYAVEWTESSIRWYLDSTEFFSLEASELAKRGCRWVFDHPFHILLNVAVGGGFGGEPDESTIFPQRMEIEYIRICQ